MLKVGPPQAIFYLGLSRHARGLGLLAWYAGNYEDMCDATNAGMEAAAGLATDGGLGYRTAAAGMALCASMVAKAGNLSAREKADRARRHAEQAVELLEKAVKAGFRNTVDVERAPEFAAIRTRPDFQKLLAELKEKKR